MSFVRNGINYGNLVKFELMNMMFLMDEFYQKFIKLPRPGVEVDSDLKFETEYIIEVEYGNGRRASVFVLDVKDLDEIASEISAITGLPTRTTSGSLIYDWWENGTHIRRTHPRL